MRDLSNEELGNVYGAGCASYYSWTPSCNAGSKGKGSKGKGSKGKGSKGKGSKNKGSKRRGSKNRGC